MKYGLYSVRDCVSEIFFQPFIERNHNTARRVFAASLKAQIKDIKVSDFELWYLGNFDSEKGEITDLWKEMICVGSKEMCDDV